MHTLFETNSEISTRYHDNRTMPKQLGWHFRFHRRRRMHFEFLLLMLSHSLKWFHVNLDALLINPWSSIDLPAAHARQDCHNSQPQFDLFPLEVDKATFQFFLPKFFLSLIWLFHGCLDEFRARFWWIFRRFSTGIPLTVVVRGKWRILD